MRDKEVFAALCVIKALVNVPVRSYKLDRSKFPLTAVLISARCSSIQHVNQRPSVIFDLGGSGEPGLKYLAKTIKTHTKYLYKR